MSHSESRDESNTPAPRRDWEDVARTAADDFEGEPDAEDTPLVRELLVFELDESAYAIAVERIREIVRMRDLTHLPRSPEWLLGVMALRGEVVEVVDFRRRLGLPASEPNRSSRIIVLHGDAERVTGVLVDSVSEVFRVSEDCVMPAQGFEVTPVTEICSRGEEFISILDPDSALGFQDV
jgi:purine-binding chemotaxis protein CheW